MPELPTPATAPPPTANPYAAAFAALRAQAPALGAASVAARRQRLTRLEGWLLRNRAAVQQALHQDFRKPAAETDLTELWPSLTELRHTRRHLRRWLARRRVGTPLPLLGTRSWVQLEPKGVVLIIAPWNYPFYLALDPLVSALAAGNAVVLKPAEQTPATSSLLRRMVQELFPPEEVLVVEGGQEVATALLALPFDHIFFTGSPAVGKVVMRAAAEHLSGITLELGGKSPAIVDDTADLRDAAQKLVWGKFLNAGQTCVAPDYLLVQTSVRDQLVQAMREVLTRAYNPSGLGAQQSPDLARIVNARHYARLAGLLADAQARGATLACGGHLDPRDSFIEPTILLDLPAGAAILEEEIFGPLLPVLTFTTLAEAAAYVNARPKPLAQYVFSGSRANQRYLLGSIAAGGAAINETILQLAHSGLPFGGVGNSGLGKAHGYAGLVAFSNEKAVLQQRVGLTNLRAFYPPYTSRTQRLLGWLLRYL